MALATLNPVRFQAASDQSLLVYVGEQISLDVHQRVMKLLQLLQAKPIAGVQDLHPAYCSLLINFDLLKLQHNELEDILRSYLARIEEVRLPEPRQIEIPVCYGGEFGPDLNEVAALHGTSPDQVIRLHTSATYLVYFLGFVPGFAYMGGLPNELATPRIAAPRKKVPEGSVGIAGTQTGIYPFATPGGWRLIGRTPLTMFRPEHSDMSLLSIGDRVHFSAISQQQFKELEQSCR